MGKRVSNRDLNPKQPTTNASCEGCPHKKNCASQRQSENAAFKNFSEAAGQSLRNITTEKGIQLRMNRSIQAEGAFGVIKQNYGFRQFLLLEARKVYTEMLLVAFGYNINKLHNKMQHNRTGMQLFEKMTA